MANKKKVSAVTTTSSESQNKAKALMERLYLNLSDPSFGKGDILRMIRSNVENDETGELEAIFGNIESDFIDEFDEMDKEEELEIETDGQGHFRTYDIMRMDKKVKSSFTEIPTIAEARFLEDIYYQTQGKRIAVENQLRSLDQGFDAEVEEAAGGEHGSTKNRSFLEWYYDNTMSMEKEIQKALAIFSDSNYLSKWAKSVKGIGPVIATCLAANLRLIMEDADICHMSAGNWWSFCGLNDNNRPWLGREKSQKIVNELLEENDGVIDDTFIDMLCEETGWKRSHYLKYAYNEEKGTWSKDKIISATSMIPYNKKLKVLCYKIGKSFMMSSKKGDSLYGKIYAERKAVEIARNLKGEYCNQAYAILQEKHFKKNTVAYQYYSKGQLPPAHIDARARRYAVKLFISHCFEAAWFNQFGEMAPNPYVIQYMGHKDYIPPEVPYDSIPRDCENNHCHD